MSQRPPASRPASRSPTDGQRITLPSVQARDGPQQGGRQPERHHVDPPGARAFQPHLQPSHQHARSAPNIEDWRSSGPSRDLGVHSILNPTEPEGSGSDRRVSGTNLDSTFPTSTLHPQFGASPSTNTPHTFPGQQPPTDTSQTVEGYGMRRILTPRSPARATGSARGRGQTYDAQLSPFLPPRGRAYNNEARSASDGHPIPTPPAQTQQQQHYGFPPPASTPGADRRTSMPSMHAPLSQSASPSMSASSLNPSNQTSPASFMYHKGGQAPQTTSSYFPGSTFGSSMQQPAGGGGIQGLQYQRSTGTTEGPYTAPAPTSSQQEEGSSLHSSSAGSSRQASASDPIQVLTITTSSGQYQVPVDVRQASRLADEKRARNAGASARFRQRRKEKEKEASTSIEKLQQQNRDLERRVRESDQERDFYRGERDRFREVVFRNPDTRHLAMQAPPSPLSIRSASSFQGQGQQLGAPPPQTGYQPPGSERAPRRRRIDAQGEYSPLPYSMPPTSLPPVAGPGFAPGPSQGPPSLPPMRRDGPAITPTSAPNQPPATPGGPQPPFDPYARGPYERGWPGPPSDHPRR
ncbi:hypothetical protein LOCC1_G003475 [Lachnellula occidentalis]|uniref:BZIP domain-containing protein n=1 Tax=Lachnellula occidentalis TaxID=215460 RepID=A0A8H8S440_9HELO|nr:hypothetical protein LOCC1_G003475 [Lachnellula occidentalis]